MWTDGLSKQLTNLGAWDACEIRSRRVEMEDEGVCTWDVEASMDEAGLDFGSGTLRDDVRNICCTDLTWIMRYSENVYYGVYPREAGESAREHMSKREGSAPSSRYENPGLIHVMILIPTSEDNRPGWNRAIRWGLNMGPGACGVEI